MKKDIYRKGYLALFFNITLLFFSLQGFSQPSLPNRSVNVTATQAIYFGAFCLETAGSSGGTVQLDWQGTRSSTGQVVLLNSDPYYPAIFEIQLCQGRNVIITYPPTTILTGSNGGSLTLNIGPTEKGGNGASFEVNNDCNFVTRLRVGGTLVIGNNSSNPGGNYTGSFSITFNQQ
ncbi:MAG: DUF4402 domain-containing protein [Bacteroidetes bacterium]|nr:DUF4402 domain-containing protein [Bacteroidota bacterium]